MSRAFVREGDTDGIDAPPERAVSPHPNLVTAAGLRKIDMQLRSLESARVAAEHDPIELEGIEREIRYWRQRRGSARVIDPPTEPSAVRFGVTVDLRFNDGDERSFQIVGEDEANPTANLLSWTSPVAKALIGRPVGETVQILGRHARIVGLHS